MKPYYEDDHVTLYHGNYHDVLPELEQVDHVIADPPCTPASGTGRCR